MAWETRDGRQYLYQSFRDPMTGKVRRRYLGRGYAAVMLATRLKERRQKRAFRRAQAALERQREASLLELDRLVWDLMAAELLAAGFHQHAGIWRRRGTPRQPSTSTPAASTLAALPPTVPPAATGPVDPLLPIRDLLERARREDVDCLPTLCQTLDDHPEIWRNVMNITDTIERPLIEEITEGDRFVAEALKAQLEGMRRERGDDTPIERLLAEYRVAAWLYHQRAQKRLEAEPESRPLQKRLRSARRRLEVADRRLAVLRRLLGRRRQ